jgi:peptidyl-prolyl cis-trans isomerase B (cyclophilin B)
MADAQPSRRRLLRPIVAAVLIVVCLAAAAWLVGLTQAQRGQGVATAPASLVTCAPPPPAPTSHPTFTAPPPPSVAAGSEWSAVLHTTCGDLTLLLDGRRAPRSVASFVTLARAGYWTDSVCHRLTSEQAPTAFLQCGDPTGRSTADPGYDLPLENVPTDVTYRVGDVGVARGDGFPSTSGEFFIVHRDFTVSPGAPVYSLVGRVTSGLDIVQHIARIGGEDFRPDGPPFQSISILTVEVRRR